MLMDLKKEVARLEKRAEELLEEEGEDAKDSLDDIYARLDELDPETAPTRYF